ncbi:transcription/translation regulatory transformer protein RfaH [Halopseudomonas maritima]|nr:transcription/translation regulatory transformer protein RfaH [Halopseudomonas maritima]UJJ33308.1 transcription/translation regulatory transformer protein RfaH [Halopseudomonas maritima]
MSGYNVNSASNWYLIQCKPRQDERAEENLRNQSFTCYRPQRRTLHVKRGKQVELVESLFPGYLFVCLDRLQDNWYSIRSTRGVARLVTFGNEPAVVSSDLIDYLHAHEAEAPVACQFSRGDSVRITEGPFSELEAIFLRSDGDERAILLLTLLHREQHLKMPLRSIKASGQRPSAQTDRYPTGLAGAKYA